MYQFIYYGKHRHCLKLTHIRNQIAHGFHVRCRLRISVKGIPIIVFINDIQLCTTTFWLELASFCDQKFSTPIFLLCFFSFPLASSVPLFLSLSIYFCLCFLLLVSSSTHHSLPTSLSLPPYAFSLSHDFVHKPLISTLFRLYFTGASLPCISTMPLTAACKEKAVTSLKLLKTRTYEKMKFEEFRCKYLSHILPKLYRLLHFAVLVFLPSHRLRYNW